MRIVIDLQGAQASNRHRGIGRYSLSLAKAIVANKGEHEIIIALSGLFPDTIVPIRAEFEGLLPQRNICIWNAPKPVNYLEQANNWRRKTAELTRESFLASLEPDIIFVSSLFEGLVDDAVIGVGIMSQEIPTAVVLYDLIPLINRAPYLDNPLVEAWYENKLGHLRRADLLLAISDSSRLEGIHYLGFPADQCINIGTAADAQFHSIEITDATNMFVREQYGLFREFVMYTGGIDHRKNIEGLIRAYAKLPLQLREMHQLVIVCSIQPESRHLLNELAVQQGLAADEMVLTGFVSEEELIILYHMCKVFVFPSWHEGFGLPVLEAMSCGAPVIAANTSSLPEVVGLEKALFNPFDENSIADKLIQVLTDEAFRTELINHGIEQAKKFSWNESAKTAINAFEKIHAKRLNTLKTTPLPKKRPRLAFVSPLPPERSGIADYSAELLPELVRHYEIDVIVEQDTLTDTWIKENCAVRDSRWLLSHAQQYDRIIYQFGNSSFHQHMFDLLSLVPGVVVLHDFFISGIVAHMDVHGFKPNSWSQELYFSHGYSAVQERFHATDTADVVWKYPCNKSILEKAVGVIVHSENSLRLSKQWIGDDFSRGWSVIPHLRVPTLSCKRAEARQALGISEDAFLVCSFGLLGPHKQNHRLLKAWLESTMRKDQRCLLVFVGENHGGNYGEELNSTIFDSGLADQIRITGWTDMAEFRQYLAAADIGVQLRTLSRGETSGTVLDCMNYGLPTIVNANGTMADFPKDAVWMLPDEFEDAELVFALDTLWMDDQKRSALSQVAREVILTKHAPRSCANQYGEAIEKFYHHDNSNRGLINAIAQLDSAPTEEQAWFGLARNIDSNRATSSISQIFVDVSELVQRDAKSGIQRVVRSILLELLKNPPKNYRIEPVYATLNDVGYNYARNFTLHFLDCPVHVLDDEPVVARNGDIFLGLDLQPHIIPRQSEFYQQLRSIGVKVYFVVYDLLPIMLPNVFHQGATEAHTNWLNTVTQADGAVCISCAVADEMADWIAEFGAYCESPLKLGWFHLGADVARSLPTMGFPNDAANVLKSIAMRPTFLMVGTIEPRKGQMQALSAFELLWEQGVDVNLVMVGKQGWMVEKLIDAINHHPENFRRLFLLDGISDEYLEKVYASSSCLIAASEGEGFGLPLIEAAQHKLPIIARNIPVFKEVAGDFATYFSGLEAENLANVVKEWLGINLVGKAPQTELMPWLTWEQSSHQLLDVILNDKWMALSKPEKGYRYFASDPRYFSAVGKKNGLYLETNGTEGHLIFGPYLSLPAGRYWVRLYGQVKQLGVPPAYADSVVRQGSEELSMSVLSVTHETGLIAEMEVLIKSPVTDFEIRLWVAENSVLRLRRLEISPRSLFENID
ncbi:MAG: glycosyltransferase [Methylococcales bacterium]|nr:glycosyltransferase [Methylococcales bacterium]